MKVYLLAVRTASPDADTDEIIYVSTDASKVGALVNAGCFESFIETPDTQHFALLEADVDGEVIYAALSVTHIGDFRPDGSGPFNYC